MFRVPNTALYERTSLQGPQKTQEMLDSFVVRAFVAAEPQELLETFVVRGCKAAVRSKMKSLKLKLS